MKLIQFLQALNVLKILWQVPILDWQNIFQDNCCICIDCIWSFYSHIPIFSAAIMCDNSEQRGRIAKIWRLDSPISVNYAITNEYLSSNIPQRCTKIQNWNEQMVRWRWFIMELINCEIQVNSRAAGLHPIW